MRAPALLIALTTAALVLTAPPVSAATGCEGADARPTPKTFAPAVLATVCLVNEERARAGLESLTLDMGLMAVGFGYARELVAEKFYGHIAPDGAILADRLSVIGYAPYAAGENMYWGTAWLETPAEAVKGWMRSEEHRRNMFEAKYRRIGIGIAIGTPTLASPAGVTYVAEFDSGADTTAANGARSPGPAADVEPASPPGDLGRDPEAGIRAGRVVQAWFEAARLGDARGFCHLEDNRLLRSQYGRIGRAGIRACVAGFQPVPGLPAAGALAFTKARARGTRATLTVAAAGQRVAFVLRKWNGHWKVDAVAR